MYIRLKLSIKVRVHLMTLHVIFDIDHTHTMCSYGCCLVDNELFIEGSYKLM